MNQQPVTQIIGPSIVSAAAPIDLGLPHPTLYVQNLPEKLKLEWIQQFFEDFFSRELPATHPDVASIALQRVIVKRRLALRGQAWLAFASTEDSKRALPLLQGTRLLGKSMRVRFARFPTSINPQDVLQRREYHRQRLQLEGSRLTLRQRRLQLSTVNPAVLMASALVSSSGASPNQPGGLSTVESLQLPNKLLFVQDIPGGVDGSELTDIFKRFAGFVEVRVVATRPDVAFVEFENEMLAVYARNAMDRQLLRPNQPPLRVAFAKR
jgi:RNA recognition motif-containing protein